MTDTAGGQSEPRVGEYVGISVGDDVGLVKGDVEGCFKGDRVGVPEGCKEERNTYKFCRK